MAFCTNCGANVQGAFCVQCGKPVSAGASQPNPGQPPVQRPPVSTPAGQVVPAPVKRKTSPLVWVLIIVVGLFVLGGLATVGAGLFLFNKARQSGLDPDLMKRNPGYAMARMVISGNPDLEEVSHNEDAGTITIREKRTGKEVTLRFGEVSDGRFSFSASDDAGKTSELEIGKTGQLPSWVPVYPGAQQEGSLSFRADDGENAQAGAISFTTSDLPPQVISFYRAKAAELGMDLENSNGQSLTISDAAKQRSIDIYVNGASGRTTINLKYSEKQ